METKIKHLIKPFLALLVLVLFSSCQKEEHEDHAVHEQNVEQKYEREEVPFRKFQENFLDSQEETALTSYLAGNNEAAFSDYLLKINRERIVAFTNEDVKTYTFNVVTSDTDSRSFTNLILYENEEGTGELLLKYTPTTDWIEALSKGNKKAFSGEMSIMDKNGNVQQTNSFDNGVEIPGKTVTPCTFTVDVIWIDCYGAQCPCTDGGGYAGGWDITYDCPPTSGGGGGGGPNSGGSGPNGGGSGGSGTGDLPTDPLEWSIFMDLTGLLGEYDDFFFDHSLDPDPNLEFSDVSEFEDFIAPYSGATSSIIPQPDGTQNTIINISDTWGPDIRIIVNSTLCNNMTGQSFVLNSINAYLVGNNYLGFLMELDGFNFRGINNENHAEIELYYTYGMDVKIGPVPIHFTQGKIMLLKMDIFSGGFRGYTEID